jgi:transcriptional regulator GlxA family with amidase domain
VAAALLDRTVRDSRDAPAPGGGAVLGKLSELLFVDAIRAYLETQPAQRGWTAGLKDATVSRALELIHRNPDAEWTLESLARAVGISRTALADHCEPATPLNRKPS